MFGLYVNISDYHATLESVKDLASEYKWQQLFIAEFHLVF